MIMLIRDEKIAKIESSIFTMKKLMLIHSRSEKDEKYDIPAATCLVIKRLVAHYKANKDPVTVSDIASQLGVSLSAVTQMLNPLEKRGIIVREKSLADRRVTYVLPTRKGRLLLKIMSKRNGAQTDMLGELLDYLGDTDSDELIRLMERIERFMKTKTEKNEGAIEINEKIG